MKRTYRKLALLAVTALLFQTHAVLAVHDNGLFQLDYVTSPVAQGEANVSSTNISPPGNTGDDWDRVFAGTSSAFATAFISDGVGMAEASFFTGGGSKDTNLISQWMYDTVSDVVPDKDDISHAFAAAYQRPSDGHTIVYFGADRFDAGDGSAQVGFWFFRSPVALEPLEPGMTTGSFSGIHQVGDLLVLVDFVQGGMVGAISVYEWDGAGGDNLELLLTQNAADCANVGVGDAVCAVINHLGGETPPWPYVDKDGNTSYQPFALFEGGIDFTALLGENIGCFSSFMAETRSSGSSVNAQLKDFALGEFNICGINVTKTGDTLSKVTDPVNYAITLENTGSATLYKRNISDTLLGAITTNGVDQANPYVTSNSCGPSLLPGATCTITATRIVQAGDPDPLPNTVHILYSEFADFSGVEFPDSDDHAVNLFQPSITLDKWADTILSKVGDDVNYRLTLTNTSSSDSPNLACVITDALLDVSQQVILASGGSHEINAPYTVQAGDPDPLVNTANVTCSPIGFPNILTASDDWLVNLFQPSVTLVKSGPAYSKAGDTATYDVTITNTSSADAPNLQLVSFFDSVVPSIMPPPECDNLASGASCSFSYDYVVQAGDPDPLVNVATVHYNPAGFPNDITDSSSWTTDLLHPSFTVTKACKAEPVAQSGPAVFTITFNNTGDADLHVVPSEGAPFSVAAGQTFSYDYSVPGPFSATVNNTVTGTVTLASRYGLSNSYTFSASDSCDVYGRANVIKTVSGQAPTGDQAFTFQLRQGASPTNVGTTLESQIANAGNGGMVAFSTNLVPGQTYQMCEIVMPGWSTTLGSFVPNSFIPPDGVVPNPNVDNSILCVNFTASSGQTVTFTVDNTPPPGGRALTIGFWKNWASCANNGGNQEPVLDQTLVLAEPNGIVISAVTGMYPAFGPAFYLVLHGSTTNPDMAPDCDEAVRILNKSTTSSGKKMASDPAFNLAAQLLAAELNYAAGAGRTAAATTAINQSVLLLGKYKFDGITHTKISAADAAMMNTLARILDDYNNNRF